MAVEGEVRCSPSAHAITSSSALVAISDTINTISLNIQVNKLHVRGARTTSHQLKQMQQLSSTGLFHYQPLDLTKKSLRLLQILHVDSNGIVVCKIRQADVKESYTALSYVWGPENPHKYVRLIDDNVKYEGLLQVRSNLHDFLIRVAATGLVTSFWIDAICIDQQNVKERNHQVRQMGTVYQNAAEVRIWLGADLATGEILSTISVVAQKGDIPVKDLFDEKLCPTEFRAVFQPEKMAGLLRNKYWSRTWIVQEILLAGKITVQSDQGTCIWSDISGLYPPQSAGQSPYMKRLVGNWRANSDLTVDDNRSYPFSAVLDAFRESECTDIRDRVYAFRALITNGDRLDVDYAETPAQLLVRAANIFDLGADQLSPLLFALRFDAKSLYLDSGICVSDLWRTQKALSQIPQILDTKLVLPLCSAAGLAACEWSSSGTGLPCSDCHNVGTMIVEMPECRNDWRVEVRHFVEKNSQLGKPFSSNYKEQFREWLCQTWPECLLEPHSLTDDHCQKCYACNIKQGIEKKRLEWEELERYVRNSSLGNQLPSLGKLERSSPRPSLRSRRFGQNLSLKIEKERAGHP